MAEEMKLFVWDDVLTDYTDGMVVALAHTVEEARALKVTGEDYRLSAEDLANEPKVYALDAPILFACWGGG